MLKAEANLAGAKLVETILGQGAAKTHKVHQSNLAHPVRLHSFDHAEHAVSGNFDFGCEQMSDKALLCMHFGQGCWKQF